MSGLSIPAGAVGIPDQQQQSIEQFWDIGSQIEAELQQMGFPPLAKPAVGYPNITPQDYATLEGEHYTHIMSVVDVWFVYAKDQHARLEGAALLLDEELGDLERELKRGIREQWKSAPKKDQPSETALKEEAASYPRCRQIRHHLARINYAKKTTKARIEGLERLASGLSRQVTIRGQEIDLGGHNTGRRPNMPFRS